VNGTAWTWEVSVCQAAESEGSTRRMAVKESISVMFYLGSSSVTCISKSAIFVHRGITHIDTATKRYVSYEVTVLSWTRAYLMYLCLHFAVV